MHPIEYHASRLFACNLETGEVRVLEDLGPLGGLSVDLAADGVLTVEGKIPFVEAGREPANVEDVFVAVTGGQS